MFDMLLNLVRGKKHASRYKADEATRAKRKEIIGKLNHDLNELRNSITEKNVREKARDFYLLIKTAFRESLSLKYEATFQEIQDEVEKRRHFSLTLREEVVAFLDDVAMMEYGYEEFKELVEQKRHEKEKLLHQYIADMEKDGEHLRHETKSKIAQIVSESIPHTDREFLSKMVDRFKVLMHQIF